VPAPQKIGRIRLTPAKYKKLCLEIMERDGWACRRCSQRSCLQVHHIIKRSFVRIDAAWNLCTLCIDCHDRVERKRKPWIEILGSDANLALAFREYGSE
jgi:5-methylcytosine-specific restriction endonuclease McrA